ncbi:protein suppressor of npr1-1 [Pyrus ussuriensis x Pyrus communis]|uniref:ADP-ribosyl cyclase/cyclic ADP-ribose hydrolase n=1 Tax=Pyrus ussuriensis x Pyrus communis TaxID=2448454 RepID=A0A5N5GGR1_9ROSA|nr:protein suppressor of npr1-1 [Pyrus ussuriensis x Pyrus communis]
MCCRSLRFSSPSSAGAASVAAAAADDDIHADNTPRQEKYDVFISFRGEDTRFNITSHLHAALVQRKIETYIDCNLQRGEEIEPALLEAIEKSTLSVIIFSQDYASSTWCLKELVHVLKCKEKSGQIVIPIFYDINPSDVRRQRGSYARAFAQLEKRFNDSIDEVQKWRDALTTAANLSGFPYSEKLRTETEADLIKKVVDHIWTRLKCESSCNLEGLVGIESRIEQIESLLGIHSQDACITVGIWGMAGIGKTTLAETVFHKLSSKFEACCFLRNVRENSKQPHGLDHLEKTLLKDILKEEGLSIGSTFVRERLSRTKDKIYEVEGLKPDDALQLFHSRAFKNTPTIDYKELAEKAVGYAGGVPLALVTLGSSLLNCKSKEEWEDELNKLKQFPNENIQRVLRLSYDRLGRNEKEIFLDIACFHKGKNVEYVKKLLGIRGFFAAAGIRVLIDMSLISIDSAQEIIEMHDLIQEMGYTIVHEQCIEDPGKRNRLFNDEDVYHLLESNTGTPIVQAILIKCWQIEKRPLKRADFKVMPNLIMLIVVYSEHFGNNSTLTTSLDLPNSLRYLYWSRYPLKYLPSNFSPENLVELHMPDSLVKQLWKEDKGLVNLEVINLQYSSDLTEVPNLSGSPKIGQINLRGCESLVEIPSYFQHLDKLTYLDVGSCTSLFSVTNICKLKSLKELDLSRCSKLESFPEIVDPIEHLESLILNKTAVQELHSSIKFLPALKRIKLNGCKRLLSIPKSICKLKYLETVEKLPSSVGNLVGLETLDLGMCKNLKVVSRSIYNLTNLKILSFYACRKLKKLPSNSVGLLSLEVLNLSRSSILGIPDGFVCTTSLRDLDLSRSTIRSLPANIKQASQLSTLCLIGCKWLQSLPELPVVRLLQAHGCTSLKTVSNIMDDAQLRIMQVAIASSKLREEEEEEEEEEEDADEDHDHEYYSYWPLVSIVCPGKKIPNWFSYRSEESSVIIELRQDWFRTGLLGFALAVVVSWELNCQLNWMVRASFNVKFKGESHEMFTSEFDIRQASWKLNDYCYDQRHVYLWNEAFKSEEVAKKCSPDFCNLANEASVEFCLVDEDSGEPTSYMKVEKCGIYPLYVEDAERFKCGLVIVRGSTEAKKVRPVPWTSHFEIGLMFFFIPLFYIYI